MTDNFNLRSEPNTTSGRGFDLRRFLSFRYMVTGNLMKIIYCIGMAVITLIGVFMILSGLGSMLQANNSLFGGSGMVVAGFLGIVSGFMVILPGNLLWRIACETWIVLFSMHEMMGSIEKLLQRGAGVTASSGIEQPVAALPGSAPLNYGAAVQASSAVNPFVSPQPALASQPQTAWQTRACPHCGNQIKAGATFCGSCGRQS